MSKRVRVALTIPEEEGPRIVYPVAVLTQGKATEGGRAFVSFLKGDVVRGIFEKYGFIVLPTKAAK